MLRIDKILAHMGYGTRTEIKKALRKGMLTVNGKVIHDAGEKVNPDVDEIYFCGEKVAYREFIYIMLNKPAGVVSATEDARDKTVIDIVQDKYGGFELFPVGRLDKDTEGLLILTNDGKFAHNILSPKKHVPKRYFVKVQGRLADADVQEFQKGITLEDGYMTLPGQLIILTSGEISEAEVVISEGKFHQVKRMFLALGKEVLYLKRIAMGKLFLEHLQLGDYRELSEEEKDFLAAKET